MGGLIARTVSNIREGRVQKLLSATTALSAPPLAFEIYLEHYKGSFGDKWMWTPLVLAPPLTVAGIAGFVSPKAARTALPLFGALFALDGLIGVWTHMRGVQKRPGGFGEAHYNLVMGPPLLAPGSLAMVGGMGVVAAVARREQ
jgi:hypothetical protein